MNLLVELKRRHVFRVAAAYAVIAWLLIQIGDIAADSLGFPAWFMPMLFVLLGLGFPVALVLSWAFDLTPEGVKRTETADVVPQAPTPGLTDGILILLLALVGGVIVYQTVSHPEAPADAAASAGQATTGQPARDTAVSIAVLPFTDLSPEGDQAYFSEGIAEEILNVLARIDGLHVASRTSSFLFRKEDKSIPVIADALGVRHVLEGSVRKAGDRVRITVQLIEAGSDTHLWSETYDRELSTENLFAIQDDIAGAVVTALGDALSLEQRRVVSVSEATANLDAYELYLRALNARAVMSTGSQILQVDLLQRAVAADPEFAEAWCALANTLVHLHTWDHELEVAPNARRGIEAARRCLALEPEDAQGWMALRSAHFYLHDWEQADRVIAEATRVSPAFVPEATHWLGLGYLEKARIQAEELIVSDPSRKGFWLLIRGLCLEAMGRYEEAIVSIEQAILNGYYGSAQSTLAEIHRTLGRPDIWVMHQSTMYLQHDPALIPLLPHMLQLEQATVAEQPAARRRLVAIAGELGFSIDDLVSTGPGWGLRVPYTIATLLGRADAVADKYWNNSPMFWMWTPSLTEFRQSDAFRQRVRDSGMLDYWQKHGWPEKCRPADEVGFLCE